VSLHKKFRENGICFIHSRGHTHTHTHKTHNMAISCLLSILRKDSRLKYLKMIPCRRIRKYAAQAGEVYISPVLCQVLHIMAAVVYDTGNILYWHMLHTSAPQCVHYFPEAYQGNPRYKLMRCQRMSVGDLYCPIVLVRLTHDIISIQQAQLSQSQMYTREQHMKTDLCPATRNFCCTPTT
jgi:hypothetical protein